MTQARTAHAFNPNGCALLVGNSGPGAVVQHFSNFTVLSGASGEMPCYAVEFNSSDKIHGYFMQLRVEEIRSSNDVTTATATHALTLSLYKNGTLVESGRHELPLVGADNTDLNHAFGAVHQDTVNYYITPFLDPNDFHQAVTFFWYLNTQSPNAIVALSSAFLIPYDFTVTDIEIPQFVAIDEGVATFSDGVLSDYVGIFANAPAIVQYDTSPCVVSEGVQSSNVSVVLSTTGGNASLMVGTPPVPPIPPTPPDTVFFMSQPKQAGAGISTPIQNGTSTSQSVQCLTSLTSTTGAKIASGTGVFTMAAGESRSYVTISLSAYQGSGTLSGTVWIADGSGNVIGSPVNITVTI